MSTPLDGDDLAVGLAYAEQPDIRRARGAVLDERRSGPDRLHQKGFTGSVRTFARARRLTRDARDGMVGLREAGNEGVESLQGMDGHARGSRDARASRCRRAGDTSAGRQRDQRLRRRERDVDAAPRHEQLDDRDLDRPARCRRGLPGREPCVLGRHRPRLGHELRKPRATHRRGLLPPHRRLRRLSAESARLPGVLGRDPHHGPAAASTGPGPARAEPPAPARVVEPPAVPRERLPRSRDEPRDQHRRAGPRPVPQREHDSLRASRHGSDRLHLTRRPARRHALRPRGRPRPARVRPAERGELCGALLAHRGDHRAVRRAEHRVGRLQRQPHHGFVDASTRRGRRLHRGRDQPHRRRGRGVPGREHGPARHPRGGRGATSPTFR